MIKRKYNYDEYLGKQIGHLTIIEILKSKLSNGRRFLAKCVCGKEKIFEANLIIRGRNKSCGCKMHNSPRPSLRGMKIEKRENLIGQKFGKLIVENYDTNYIKNQTRWMCRCECGVTKSIKASHLKCGNVKTCGKCSKSGKNCYKWRGHEEISRKFFYCIERGAKSRKIQFNLTIEQIWDLYLRQNKKCALSGLQLNFPSIVGANDGTASLDRIDSSVKNYTIENCQWVHKDVNNLKWDFTQNEFINYCRIITEYQNKKASDLLSEAVIDYQI